MFLDRHSPLASGRFRSAVRTGLFILSALCLPGCHLIRTFETTDADVLAVVAATWCKGSNETDPNRYHLLSDLAPSSGNGFLPYRVSPDVIESFRLRNQGPHLLPPLETCAGLRLTSQGAVDAALTPREGDRSFGWSSFYDTFPGAKGVIHLSVPGYSARRDVAVVQVSGACGWLCGGGTWWVLRRQNGRWLVVERLEAWVS
jgi:hypothetical protein